MHKFVLCGLLCGCLLQTAAQPYVDPLQLRYLRGFHAPATASRATPYSHFVIGSDLPLSIGHGSYFLVSPYAEFWSFDSATRTSSIPAVKGLVLPLGLLLRLSKKLSWIVNLQARSQGETLFADNSWQLGVATLASIQAGPDKKWRMGVYVSGEFFGLFIMPLVGADWKIDERNYLFGVLPGRLTWEHKYSNHFFAGTSFRAITSSYRLDDGRYLRIDDNRLSVYADWYPVKSICLTLEPGFGLLRQLRTGREHRVYAANDNWGDGLFIQLSAAYRIRL